MSRLITIVRPEGFEPPAYCSVVDRDMLLELHELEEADVWPPVLDIAWAGVTMLEAFITPRPRPASDSIGFALVGIA